MCDGIKEKMANAVLVHLELFRGIENSPCNSPEVAEGIVTAAEMIRSGDLTIGPEFGNAHNAITRAGIDYCGAVADVTYTVARRVLAR